MATPDDIEVRLSAVERDLALLRAQQHLSASDAGAARVLAAGADHDVSEVRAELRAHTSALNALREVQVDHGRRLDRLEDKVDSGFTQVDGRFAQVDARFAQVDTRFDQIDAQFAQVDENFATVTAQLTTVHAGLRQIVGLLERP